MPSRKTGSTIHALRTRKRKPLGSKESTSSKRKPRDAIVRKYVPFVAPLGP
jgi:hypothetical protein